MAEVQKAPASNPQPIPGRTSGPQIPPPIVALPPPSSATKIRNTHLNLDTFSPVNQNGSFEFDRVLKSGYVQKRTRKTKVQESGLSSSINYTNLLCRLGNPSTLYFDQISFQYTRTKTKPNFVTRFTSATLRLLLSSRIQNRSDITCSGYFSHQETIILRLSRSVMPKNGSISYEGKLGSRKKRKRCFWQAQ